VLAAAVAAAAPAGKAGLHVRMRVEGSGPRTVIFESGLGDTLSVWDAVQPRVAAGCARTVSYDRAGYAWSDLVLSRAYLRNSLLLDTHRPGCLARLPIRDACTHPLPRTVL